MFIPTFKKNSEPTDLDKVIDRLFAYQQDQPETSPEFSQATEQLTILYKLRDDTTSKKPVSKDALIQVAGSLVGVLMVLGYEHAHSIGSKALASVLRRV